MCLAFRVVPGVVIPYVTRFAVGRERIEKRAGTPHYETTWYDYTLGRTHSLTRFYREE